MYNPTTVVRQVWDSNFDYELSLIYDSLFQIDYRIASLDTEFPGTVFTIPSNVPKHQYTSCPEENYLMLKKNADALKLIQLGLTLCDSHGIMYTWQFNFRDFDPAHDLHNPVSISMLRGQGIDFSVNRLWGVESRRFALGFRRILELLRQKKVVWVTFQGSYDFALLIKILTRKNLPQDVDKFMELLGKHFGFATFDVKLVTRSIGIHGGLDKVAIQLGLEQRTGSMRHHAGSDSLLVMQVFMKIYRDYKQVANSNEYSHKLYGLTLSHSGIMYQPSSSSSRV